MKKLPFILISILLFIFSCTSGQEGKINNGIRASDILKSIDKGKAVLIRGKIITDDLDFTKVRKIQVFSSSSQIAVIDVPVTFLDCIFMGKVITNGSRENKSVNTAFRHFLTFEACDFRQEVDFDNITVEANVNFTGAIFRERAKFNNVTFKGRNNFFTAFSSEKYFSMQESLINGSIDFFKAKTAGKISFQSTEFRGIARFSEIDNTGTSDFSLTRFRDDALFTYSDFAADFRMAGSVLQGRFDLNSVNFHANAYLTDSKFSGPVNFRKTSTKGKFDLSQSIFLGNPPDFTDFLLDSEGQVITLGTKIVNYHDLIPFNR